MAFLRSVLKQGVSKHISASNPSIYQSLRCMSSSKIFSGGLPWGLDESGLRDTFSQYDAKVIIDREMNRSRGFATSASTEEASSAVQAIPSREKSRIKQLPIRRMGDNKKSLNSKSLQAFKHPKYTNKIAAFKTLPAVRPSLNYSVMQFHFDPLFRIPLAPGPSNAAQGIQCQMKTTTYIARLSRSFLLPFGDVFSKDKVREKLLGQFIQKCFNLMGKDPKVMELIEKCSPRIRLIKGIEMMMEIILKNRKILPYGYNSYLNKVNKMRSLLSNRTNTNTLIESVKIPSVYQSASLIAQDIAVQLKRKRSFRSIFSQIVKKIPRKGIEGIRIRCKGRLQGAEMAKTECGKYGKSSTNSVHKKIDYAFAEVPTRYGMVGVKVWISYSGDFGGGSAPLESGSAPLESGSAGNDDYANRS